MSFAKITGEGLLWITVLVMVLWGCILLEDSTVKHARRETAKVLFDLQQMREGRTAVPASQPSRASHVYRPQAG